MDGTIIKEARPCGEVERTGVEARERLLWQTKLLRELAGHQGFPGVFDFFELDGHAYLSCEDVGDCSLKDFLARGNVPSEEQVLSWMAKVASGLMEMHAKGIYAFDLSPDNVVIGNDGLPRLIDLELAWRADAPAFPGMQVGTPGFYPRPRAGTDSSAVPSRDALLKRDLFALAGLLYILLNPGWYRRFLEHPDSLAAAWRRPRMPRNVPQRLRELYGECIRRTSRMTVAGFLEIVRDGI